MPRHPVLEWAAVVEMPVKPPAALESLYQVAEEPALPGWAMPTDDLFR